MRAAPSVAVFLAGVLGIAASATPADALPASPATPSASDCVNIRSAETAAGLTFDVQNGCDKRLSCALTWTLTCENASGKVTSRTTQEARFSLEASASHQAMGSSATCKDSWKIDGVGWECAPSGK